MIAFKASPTLASGLFIWTNFGEVKLHNLSSTIDVSDINLILYPNFFALLISSILIFEIPSIKLFLNLRIDPKHKVDKIVNLCAAS